MKKIIITLCFLIVTSISLGQKISEKRLKKEINKITVLKNSFVGIHFDFFRKQESNCKSE